MVRIVEVEERSAAWREEVGGGGVSIYDQKTTRRSAMKGRTFRVCFSRAISLSRASWTWPA